MLLCFELVGFMGVIKNELRVIFNLMYKRWKLTIAHIQISGGIRLLAARAEQDEQVVDGKMSVEMPAPAAHLPTCPPAHLPSCLLVPPALQTRIYTALQEVARQ